MNKRIDDLIEQSRMHLVTTKDMTDVVDGCYIVSPEQARTLAETVVKECVDQLTKEWYRINNLPPFENETPRDVGMRVGAKSEVLRMVAVLKDHFGINE